MERFVFIVVELIQKKQTTAMDVEKNFWAFPYVQNVEILIQKVQASAIGAANNNERVQEVEKKSGPRGIRTLGPRHVKAVS